MQAILPSKPLKEAVHRLIATLGSRVNPLLGYIHLESTPAALRLTSTNGPQSQSVTITGEVSPGPAVLLPGSIFQNLVQFCVGEQTRLSYQEHAILIQSGSFRAEVTHTTPENYPLPEWPQGGLSLPGHLLAEALDTVRYAALTQIAPNLKGVRLELHPDRLRAVSTDGFRIAWQEHLLQETYSPGAALLPLSLVQLIVQAFKNHPEPVTLTLQEKTLFIQSSQIALQGDLLDGTFPPYQRVAQNPAQYHLTLEAPLLAEALKRMTLVHTNQLPRVRLDASNGLLTLSTSGELGSSSETLAAESNAPIAFEINALYLLEALKPLEGSVDLYLQQPGSPIRLEGSRPGYLAVVAPMK
ncbi:MAG: hypothetical protein N2047_03965 [Meiothermus sp.]|nr:hypothetical protein [Meiothermus sp.]GIW31435.1 MAG: DNA polymerase III subunit beta [Meiothermus sp.]